MWPVLLDGRDGQQGQIALGVYLREIGRLQLGPASQPKTHAVCFEARALASTLPKRRASCRLLAAEAQA
jgi:hypothetical protein